MNPHLQVETQNGKTRIYYKDEALSKGIEVHPDSIDFALGAIVKDNAYNSNLKFTKTGDLITGVSDGLYPVSVRVKEYKWIVPCQEKGDCEKPENGWRCQGACKLEYCTAILEEIKDEHDSPILNEILSEITPEEQAKTDKEMTEKMEAPDAEKMRMIFEHFKFLKVAHLRDLETQVTNGEITYSKMVESINEMAYDFYLNKVSSLRKEVEADVEVQKQSGNKEALKALENVLTLIDTLTPKKR